MKVTLKNDVNNVVPRLYNYIPGTSVSSSFTNRVNLKAGQTFEFIGESAMVTTGQGGKDYVAWEIMVNSHASAQIEKSNFVEGASITGTTPPVPPPSSIPKWVPWAAGGVLAYLLLKGK